MSRAGPADEAAVPVLPALVRDWNETARDHLEERIGILEDAHMSPERAARAAEHITREWWSKRSTHAAPVR